MSLLAKIAKTSQEIGALGKNDQNPYHKYKYVSIDAYYEAVPGLAIANGVFWTTSEEKVEDLENGDIRTTYLFAVADIEDDDSMIGVKISVTHPYQGAQTSGASFSYAEKVFMRSLFKIVSGEPDSDALEGPQTGAKKPVNRKVEAPHPNKLKPLPEEVLKPSPKDPTKLPGKVTVEDEASILYNEILDGFDAVNTVEELATTLVKQRQTANKLKSLDPDLYQKAMGYYHESVKNMEVRDGKV